VAATPVTRRLAWEQMVPPPRTHSVAQA